MSHDNEKSAYSSGLQKPKKHVIFWKISYWNSLWGWETYTLKSFSFVDFVKLSNQISI